MNCWLFMKCGRQVNGSKVSELGVCPASTERRLHGVNNGLNGGRACWALAGTLCGSKVQGTYAMKMHNCLECEFYQLVRKEEGVNFQGGGEIIKILKKP
jgi:hypothetical protein